MWAEQKEYYSKEGNNANWLGKHSILHAYIDDNYFLKNVYFSNEVSYKPQIVIGVQVCRLLINIKLVGCDWKHEYCCKLTIG